MTNDKPTLTRRRVLGSMATIGAAGAVGAGAWAQYSDTETGKFEAQAGTLDLKIDGGDDVATVDVGQLSPMDNVSEDDGSPPHTREATFPLSNTGNTTGHRVEITFPEADIVSNEGAGSEAEENDGGTGELDDQTKYNAALVNGSTSYFFGGSDSYVPFRSIKGSTYGVNESIVGDGGQSTSDLVVGMKFPERPDNNEAMGDILRFNVEATLLQNTEGSSSPPE